MAPVLVLYGLVRGRRLLWLALVLLVSGLMMTVVANEYEPRMGNWFVVLPAALCVVVAIGLEWWRVRKAGRRVAEIRQEVTLRIVGSVPATFVLFIASGIVAVVVFWIGVAALVVGALYLAFRLFDGGSGTVVRERLSSVSAGDLIWAEIANSQDGEKKVRPCVVMVKRAGSVEVLYCTSQEKRSGDSRFLELPVDLGTGKDNFLNLHDRRTVTETEFRNRVGALPPALFSAIKSRVGG